MRHAANPQQRQEWHRPRCYKAHQACRPYAAKFRPQLREGYLHPRNQGGSFLNPHPAGVHNLLPVGMSQRHANRVRSYHAPHHIQSPRNTPSSKPFLSSYHPQFFAVKWGIFDGLTSQLFSTVFWKSNQPDLFPRRVISPMIQMNWATAEPRSRALTWQ